MRSRLDLWIFRRGLAAMAASALGLAALMLLVQGVEGAAGGGGPGSFGAGLLATIEESSWGWLRATPLAAALGGGLAALGLVKTGELTALQGAGLRPARILAMVGVVGLLLGGVAALLQEGLARRGLETRGAIAEETWVRSGPAVFHLEPGGSATAWVIGPGPSLERHVLGDLQPRGSTWSEAEHPWSHLPSPAMVAARRGWDLGAVPWRSLPTGDPAGPGERVNRASRLLTSALLALSGALAVVAVGAGAGVASGSAALLVALAPALVVELLAAVTLAMVAQGDMGPSWLLAVRVAVPALAMGLALRRA